MRVEPFKYEHVESLFLQPAQQYLQGWVSKERAEFLETQPSFSGIEGDRVLACSGIINQWSGRAIAWAFLTDLNPVDFLKVHRAVASFLDGCYVARIEATVDLDFEPGHRWIQMLGFDLEAPLMRGYLPNGGNASLYARVR